MLQFSMGTYNRYGLLMLMFLSIVVFFVPGCQELINKQSSGASAEYEFQSGERSKYLADRWRRKRQEQQSNMPQASYPYGGYYYVPFANGYPTYNPMADNIYSGNKQSGAAMMPGGKKIVPRYNPSADNYYPPAKGGVVVSPVIPAPGVGVYPGDSDDAYVAPFGFNYGTLSNSDNAIPKDNDADANYPLYLDE